MDDSSDEGDPGELGFGLFDLAEKEPLLKTIILSSVGGSIFFAGAGAATRLLVSASDRRLTL